jgi:hypothetical protein
VLRAGKPFSHHAVATADGVAVLCPAAATARLDMLMMLQPCRRLMRSVNLSQTTVCVIVSVFLTYQLSKAILRHAPEASFADATSVTQMPVCLLVMANMARKLLVCKIIEGPLPCGHSLPNYWLWTPGPPGSTPTQDCLQSVTRQEKWPLKLK